jgi:2-phosphosulfolactate phosphatase
MTAEPARESDGQASIDVAFTPADVRPADIALVVDVLRASTTIVAALAAGFERVLCVGDIEGARRLSGPGRELAGEKGCRPIEGFDYGNSPGAFTRAPVPELVLCTTNGTPAVLAAAEVADEVLVASLVNLDAIVRAVPEGAGVAIVCSGTDGRFALEDAYLAGRLAQRLGGTRTDAAAAAAQLAGSYADSYAPLAQSSDAEVLRDTGQSADIDFCARESVFDVVPRVSETSEGIAVVKKENFDSATGSAVTHRTKPMDHDRTSA